MEDFGYSENVLDAATRRIGARQQIGQPVQFRPHPPANDKNRRKRRGKAVEPREAILDNLSLSGARLLMRADKSLIKRTLLELDLGGVRATVRVIRVMVHPDPAAMWCGVEFVLPGEQFVAAVSRAIQSSSLPVEYRA